MKYIKDSVDDKISRVKRDCIKDYDTGEKNFFDSTKNVMLDLIQVYPWEDDLIRMGKSLPKFYYIDNKCFINQETWDERVNKYRSLSYTKLLNHLLKDKRVILKQFGWLAWAQSWFGKDPYSTGAWLKGELTAAKKSAKNSAEARKKLDDYLNDKM